jgi:outer membrane protein OmpA-like peptidoglycan-associated protein
MRVSSAIIAAGIAAGLSMAASAQTNGLYAGAEAGVNFVPTLTFNANDNIWKQQQDPGYAILGQVGYGFGNIRLEGEVGWRQNGLNKFSDELGSHSVSGNVNALSVMGNVYYDFVNDSPFTPYLGVGIGGVNVAAGNIKQSGLPLSDDSNFVLGYQGIAGVSYAVDANLSLRADYRYLRTENATWGVDDSYGGGYASGHYQSHTVAVGFIWKFDAPAPVAAAQHVAAPMAPPAPAPAPAPAPKQVQAAPIPKNFMIFFDFDKSDLTPAAQAILTQAADAIKKQGSTQIALTGYTDTVGSAEYNLKLSMRRAEAAKKFLVNLGVPASEISTVGKGKTDLLVPTKDGVREAQNRRVQIVLQ